MIELSSAPRWKARIWLDDCPNYSYSVSQVLACQVPVNDPRELIPRSVAVELFLNQGGYFPYGLLGANFVPVHSDQLIIQVHVSSENGQIVENPLANRIDLVKRGLPLEYAEGVLHGAKAAAEIMRFGSGTLSFTCAAHGEIGSSSHLFRQLAGIVVQLIPLATSIIQVDSLHTLINNAINL